MMKEMKTVGFSALLLATGLLPAEVSWAEAKSPSARVAAYVTVEMAKQHIPGVAIAVLKRGRVLLAKGYGMADVECSVPATKDTVFDIASLTKSFTAIAVLMLVQEGKVT